ncbi:MAG: beta-1,6-N-acetylglucosaminyltransferase [Bacteroidota bacterium]
MSQPETGKPTNTTESIPSKTPRLGFAMLSHRPPGKVFMKLLERLRQFPNAEIVLHHDYNQSNFPEEVIREFNIRVLKNYRTTKWGHVSKVPATLDVFTELYNTEPPVDWFITMSPNCYLVRSPQEILDFLAHAQADVYMEQDPIIARSPTVARFHYKTLYTRPWAVMPFISRHLALYWRSLRYPVSRADKPFNDQYKPFCGSDWYMMNRKAMKQVLDADLYNHPTVPYISYVNSFPDRNASPIEIIIQSFIANNKTLKVDTDFHRYIDWKDAIEWHPNPLTMRHFDAIAKSTALFARKFTDSESMELIERIDRELIKG